MKSSKFVWKYEPLRFLEIKRNEPFYVEITKRRKVCFHLKTALDVFLLFEHKYRLLTFFSETNFAKQSLLAKKGLYLSALEMVYSFRKKGSFFSEMGLKRAFIKWGFENIESFFDLFKKILMFQTRLFFFVDSIRNLSVYQSENTLMDFGHGVGSMTQEEKLSLRSTLLANLKKKKSACKSNALK